MFTHMQGLPIFKTSPFTNPGLTGAAPPTEILTLFGGRVTRSPRDLSQRARAPFLSVLPLSDGTGAAAICTASLMTERAGAVVGKAAMVFVFYQSRMLEECGADNVDPVANWDL